MPGHGKEKHERIFKLVRSFLSFCDLVQFCVGDDNIMGHCVDKNKYGVSDQYPDLVFYTYDYEHPVLVEIGTYNPDKWSGPVIHVGFNLDVAYIGNLSRQAREVSALLSHHLKNIPIADDG